MSVLERIKMALEANDYVSIYAECQDEKPKDPREFPAQLVIIGVYPTPGVNAWLELVEFTESLAAVLGRELELAPTYAWGLCSCSPVEPLHGAIGFDELVGEIVTERTIRIFQPEDDHLRDSWTLPAPPAPEKIERRILVLTYPDQENAELSRVFKD